MTREYFGIRANWFSEGSIGDAERERSLVLGHEFAGVTRLMVALLPTFVVIPPQPAHGVRKDGAAVLERMIALPQDELVVILAVSQCCRHILVCNRPVAEDNVEIMNP